MSFGEYMKHLKNPLYAGLIAFVVTYIVSYYFYKNEQNKPSDKNYLMESLYVSLLVMAIVYLGNYTFTY